MANHRVNLVWLCKTEDGWKRYPAVVGKNGRVRPGYVMVDGQQREYPEGRYQIRTYEGRRTVYANAGPGAAQAMTAKLRKEHLIVAKESAQAAGVKIEETPGRVSLARELNRFVQAAEDRGKTEAPAVYRSSGDEFLRILGKTFADEVTPEDILRWQRELRKRGLSNRTIHNRHAHVKKFLRWCKVPDATLKELMPERPKYEKTIPEIYSDEELKTFFASLEDAHLHLTFEILLKTGLREQEAMYLEWPNIDLSGSKLMVRSKPQYGFYIKDCEERDIPVPADLLSRLKAYRKQHPKDRLVTGTSTGRPNKKLLRTLKRAVHAAALNCGHCDSCKERNECERWFLHKFRATCITKLLRSGMDLRTVMKFSGHSDLESVMRYLSPASDDAIKAHVSSMQWM